MTTVILRTTARLLVPVMAIASLHLLWRGHDDPGGGFIGGLVAGAAMVLHRSSHPRGRGGDRRGLIVVTTGFLTVLTAALLGFVWGDALLAGASWTVPVGSGIKLSSALLFDAGVFAIVLGVVTTLVDSLGEDAW